MKGYQVKVFSVFQAVAEDHLVDAVIYESSRVSLPLNLKRKEWREKKFNYSFLFKILIKCLNEKNKHLKKFWIVQEIE